MYQPSSDIWERLHSAEGGLWLDQARDGEVIPVLKLQTSALKAIHRSAEVRFLVSVVRYRRSRVCCTGIETYHDPDYPVILFGTCCGTQEQQRLNSFLSGECSRMFWFDELSRCVALASCVITADEARIVITNLGQNRPLYRGKNRRFKQQVLDRYQEYIEDPSDETICGFVDQHSVALSTSIVKAIQIVGLTQDSAGRFRLDDETDGEEGSGLEQSIHQVLDSTFADRLFRSPRLADGHNGRELTDILCISDEGIVLIESKVSPLLIPHLASSERRANRVEKNIKKGFRQLVGAIRQVRAGTPIFRRTGEPIPYDKDNHIHAVILVSDMSPSLDWEAIAGHIKQLSFTHNAFFNVLDLSEIRKIVGAGEQSDLFHVNLIKRCAEVIKSGSGLVRGRIPTNAQD